jgi:hypothetical protein
MPTTTYPRKGLPNTAHSVFYSYAITTGPATSFIGSFEKFGSSFTRTHERIREVLFSRGPITKEIVWGGTDIQVTLSKVELYSEPMLKALGIDIYTIEDFNFSVDILEYMYIPSTPGIPSQVPGGNNGQGGNVQSAARVITYKNCVPTQAAKDVDTTTARILETMTLECTTVVGAVVTV